MTDEQPQLDVVFYQLILSMQANAWTALGKTASPVTGKIERNLEQAKFSIDMLEMLQRKTEGNLNEEERRLLEQTLFQLRMNYVDEVKKDQEKPQESADESSDTGAGDMAEGGEPKESQESESKKTSEDESS